MFVYLRTTVLSLIFLFTSNLYAQDEFFHEFSLDYTFLEHEKWETSGEVYWKNLYNSSGWRRWGVSLEGARKFDYFNLSGGLNANYTFNKIITNFFELRPWWAFNLNVPLIKGLDLRQRFRSEWRFFFEQGAETRDNYGRFRYRIAFDIALSEKKTLGRSGLILNCFC